MFALRSRRRSGSARSRQSPSGKGTSLPTRSISSRSWWTRTHSSPNGPTTCELRSLQPVFPVGLAVTRPPAGRSGAAAPSGCVLGLLQYCFPSTCLAPLCLDRAVLSSSGYVWATVSLFRRCPIGARPWNLLAWGHNSGHQGVQAAVTHKWRPPSPAFSAFSFPISASV